MMTCRRFFTAGVSDTVFSTLFALLAACGTVPTTKATPESELAARVARASTHVPCVSGEKAAGPCLDDQGNVWSKCAWNSCGVDAECRVASQARVAAGSCGEPEWPACRSK